MFEGVLGSSILARAARDVADPAAPDDASRVRPAAVSYHLHNLRDHSTDAKHQKVDAPPYGGGPGMVIQCQPVWDAVQAITAEDAAPPRRILTTPKGQPLTQQLAERLAAEPRLLIIAGHYEGLDQRVVDRLHEDAQGAAAGDDGDGLLEISVGDYVLSGGELPAMTIIDAVVRLLPGVLGHADSAHEDSFSPGVDRLLDHPPYTRPPQWDGRDVPAVLQSGDHAKITAWRSDRSRQLTRERRPDLLEASLGLGPAATSAASPREQAAESGSTPAGTATVSGVASGGGVISGGGGLVVVRDAGAGEGPAIRAVHAEAFPTDAEARLVDRLLAGHDVIFSILAEAAGQVVGHTLLTSMTHEQGGSVRGLVGLAPLAVRPETQRRGIGRALVREALRQSAEHRVAAVFVLGDPDFYRPLGFEPASNHGLTSKYDAGDAFLVHLPPGRKAPPPGRVEYARAFEGLPG